LLFFGGKFSPNFGPVIFLIFFFLVPKFSQTFNLKKLN
jgi:hypothetical protein